MIMCCRRYNKPFVTVYLTSDEQFFDRKLEVAVCTACGALIAELTQFNTQKGAYEVIRPKRKNIASFIKKMQELEWKNPEVKTVSKGNMGFVYGVNREHKNGKIYQYAVDFNGEKKLVKVLAPSQNSTSEQKLNLI